MLINLSHLSIPCLLNLIFGCDEVIKFINNNDKERIIKITSMNKNLQRGGGEKEAEILNK